MTRRRKPNPEVVDVVKRLISIMASPEGLIVDEYGCEEVGDVDELVNSLLSSALSFPGVKGAAAPVETFSGTKPISIRLHTRVINAFKVEAIKTGTPYQTLMHQALAEAAEKIAV